MPRNSQFAALLLPMLLTACATTAPPEPRSAVKFASLVANGKPAIVVDKRAPAARAYRVIVTGGTYTYFDDTAFEPSLIDLVTYRIGAVLPNRYQDMPVELTRIDVGYWKDSVDMSSTPDMTYYGALGVGLTYALTYAVQSSKVRAAAIANIEVRVGGYPITSVDVVPVKGDASKPEALERAVASGLKTIAEKVAAMEFWDQPLSKP